MQCRVLSAGSRGAGCAAVRAAYVDRSHGPVGVAPTGARSAVYALRTERQPASTRWLVGPQRVRGGGSDCFVARMGSTAGHSVQHADPPRAEADRANGQSALGAAFTLVKCNWGIGMSECLPDPGHSDASHCSRSQIWRLLRCRSGHAVHARSSRDDRRGNNVRHIDGIDSAFNSTPSRRGCRAAAAQHERVSAQTSAWCTYRDGGHSQFGARTNIAVGFANQVLDGSDSVQPVFSLAGITVL
jgi:hypothetical protein